MGDLLIWPRNVKPHHRNSRDWMDTSWSVINLTDREREICCRSEGKRAVWSICMQDDVERECMLEER